MRETSIIIENTCPESWMGRSYHVGLYKDEDLILVKRRLPVGNHAEFQLSNELLFGVINFPLDIGEDFCPTSVTTDLFAVNLNNFCASVVVTLTQKHGSGEFVFTAEETEVF